MVINSFAGYGAHLNSQSPPKPLFQLGMFNIHWFIFNLVLNWTYFSVYLWNRRCIIDPGWNNVHALVQNWKTNASWCYCSFVSCFICSQCCRLPSTHPIARTKPMVNLVLNAWFGWTSIKIIIEIYSMETHFFFFNFGNNKILKIGYWLPIHEMLSERLYLWFECKSNSMENPKLVGHKQT